MTWLNEKEEKKDFGNMTFGTDMLPLKCPHCDSLLQITVNHPKRKIWAACPKCNIIVEKTGKYKKFLKRRWDMDYKDGIKEQYQKLKRILKEEWKDDN